MYPSDGFVYTTTPSNHIVYATPPSSPINRRVTINGIEFNGDMSDMLTVLCKEISDLKKRVEELESLKKE